MPARGPTPGDAGDQPALKEEVDGVWRDLRDLLQEVSAREQAWNALAPCAMPVD